MFYLCLLFAYLPVHDVILVYDLWFQAGDADAYILGFYIYYIYMDYNIVPLFDIDKCIYFLFILYAGDSIRFDTQRTKSYRYDICKIETCVKRHSCSFVFLSNLRS